MYARNLIPLALILVAWSIQAYPAEEEEGYAVGPPPPAAKKCPPADKKEEVKDGKQQICIKDELVSTCPIAGLEGEWKDKMSDKDNAKRENPDGKKDKAGFVWVCTKDNNEENCCHKEKKWTWEKRCCNQGSNKDKKEGKQDDKTKGYWHCNRDKPLDLGKGKESKAWAWVLYCKDPCKRKAGDPVDKKCPKKGKWKCCCKTYEWAPECGGKTHPQAKEFKGKFPADKDKDQWDCVDDKWVQKSKCPPAGKKEEVKDGKQHICIKDEFVCTCPIAGLDGEWKDKMSDKDNKKRENPDGKKDKAGFVWVCTKDKNEENCCHKEKKWTWEKRCCTAGANKDKKEGKQCEKSKGYWHCNRDKPLDLGKGKESKAWAWVLYCKDPCKRKAGEPVDKANPKKGKWKCCCKTYEWAPECGGKTHPQANDFKGKFPAPDDKDKWECVSDKWVEKKKEEPKEEGYATS